jgi:hypothetical protein
LNTVQQKRLSERLHDESQARKERTLASLREKMLFNASDYQKKKLDANEQQQCVDNLYELSRKKKDTVMKKLEQKYMVNPLKNDMKLNREAMEASVEKLYTLTLQRKQASMERLETRYLPEPMSRTLEEEEMQESLQRLYRDHDTRRKDNISKLREKYLFTHPSEGKAKLSVQQVQEMGKRLCNVPPSTSKDIPWPTITSAETREKLQKKYLEPVCHSTKRTPEQWTDTLGRLYPAK